MGFKISTEKLNHIIGKLSGQYEIYAPKVFAGEGCFSDTDSIRYGIINKAEDIVFDRKSDYSFKEVLFPVSETVFYFTEDQVNVPATGEVPLNDGRRTAVKKKGRIIFLRSCDLHAVKRFDEIYLKNGFEDHYYKRLRDDTKFILMGCPESFENCFCVSMNTNKSDNYDGYIHQHQEEYYIESKWDILSERLMMEDLKEIEEAVQYVTDNEVEVNIPKKLDLNVMKSEIWNEYNERCIACGRCNFACPTCTCFTMQDIFYKENSKTGERRRVWASCHVDGYTDMAGGHCFRNEKGQRMRFKVMHKVYDYKKRFGYHMCVGCGRCDDICPEYISFSNCVNKLEGAMKEVTAE